MNYIYEGKYSSDEFENIVLEITGSEIDIIFPLPEGGSSFRAGDFRFNFGDFDAEYNHLHFTVENTIKAAGLFLPQDTSQRIDELISVGDSEKTTETKRLSEIIEKFMYPAGRELFSLEIIAHKISGEIIEIAALQIIDGLPVESHVIYAVISQDETIFAAGKWYFGNLENRYTMPLLDSVNILFKAFEADGAFLSGDAVFLGMELIYSVVWHESSRFYLIPSWKLSFSDGTELIYNTLTGNRI